MTVTRTIVIFNQNKNKKIDEKNRRLIAKSIPLCEAYSCHLTLVNYETKKNPIEFAEEMAESTSIGKSGDLFIKLAKKGFVRITSSPYLNKGMKKLCVPQNLKKTNALMAI